MLHPIRNFANQPRRHVTHVCATFDHISQICGMSKKGEPAEKSCALKLKIEALGFPVCQVPIKFFGKRLSK
jgi:hypothetical protein